MRTILIISLAACLCGPAQAVENLGPKAAFAAVSKGEMILVDIRRPDEWSATGVAQGALRINMLGEDFLARIQALQVAHPGKMIGLICQAGVRSANLSQRLEDAGMTQLVDVIGGTQLWISQGLPVAP